MYPGDLDSEVQSLSYLVVFRVDVSGLEDSIALLIDNVVLAHEEATFDVAVVRVADFCLDMLASYGD